LGKRGGGVQGEPGSKQNAAGEGLRRHGEFRGKGGGKSGRLMPYGDWRVASGEGRGVRCGGGRL
jgi:hypothetical protein